MSKKKKNKKDIFGEHLLDENTTLKDLKGYIKEADQAYSKALKRMRILDGADKGKLWEVVKAKFPSYQITPDTNHVNTIKEELVASIYTVGKTAELIPKSPDDVETVVEINSAFDTIWDNIKADEYQLMAGERAALLNLGITQVGWDKTILGGTDGNWYKGDVVFKNIDPMKFRRDPYVDDFTIGRYVFYSEDFSDTLIKSKKIYKERIDEILKANDGELDAPEQTNKVEVVTDKVLADKNKAKYHTLTYMWVMKESNNPDGYEIDEIHILDGKYILFVKQGIKPNSYPFSLLYCNLPGSDLIGASEPAKIFANSLTYNMISSIQATAAYKSQRPPKFVDASSGINLRQFAKQGNDADSMFIVNGDASRAVHYGEFPDLPADLQNTKANIAFDIQDTSGIDERYKGKDTGSVQTTGGMDSMLTRATQRDLTKISLYEKYTKRLAELVVNHLVQFSTERKYTLQDPISQEFKEVKIDFPKIDDDIRFGYKFSVQSMLPKNKARLAATANMLLEKQAQYQPDPEIITVEEWLLMQDLPFKDLIFKRMGIQRNTSVTQQVAQTLVQFSDLVQEGLPPELAMESVVDTLQGQQSVSPLGNVGGSVQAAQMGPQEMTEFDM